MRTKTSFLLIFLFSCLFVQAQNILWYKQPAKIWEEALPIGNGRLGGMVFGKVEYERVELNEKSVWTGSQGQSPDRDSAYLYLPQVRKLLFEGKYAEAQEITEHDMMAQGNWNMYQALGDLFIQTQLKNPVSDYKRELNLDEAIAKVSFSSGNVIYTREYFSSPVDQVIVIKLTASKKGALNFSTRLSRPKDASILASENTITMSGQVTAGGVDMKNLNPGVCYETQLKIGSSDGSVNISGDSLKIENATTATIYIVASTNYWGKNPHIACKNYLKNLKDLSFEKIKQAHIKEHQCLFQRVNLDLGTTGCSKLPTDQRLDSLRKGANDPSLYSLYFQYGRYLLICSSRPGDLPANLQGIWGDGLVTPWNDDYHVNINLQMNYWPAEVTNLSECHLPFIAFTDSLRRNGRLSASKMYNCRGFMAHFASDAWYWTTATGKAEWGMWPMGAAWCCQHLWEHYAFTQNREYLRYAYPIMKEAALFFTDYLTVNPKTGYLVTGPSSSPENKFKTPDGKISNITMGPTMDMEIVWDLFTNTIEASKILDADTAFRSQLEYLKSRLSPLQIGKDGRLMEWTEEFEEAEPGHRHISHLFGLHPGKEISVIQTPELAAAARKTIEYRLSHGGGHTGWSRAWIINFFARLHDGNKACDNLLALLTKSTLKNLLDNHPPFQIDGNLGGTAGIAEMLMQSQTGEVELLPALPDSWENGSVTGLCARGGFQVDLKWKEGKLVKVKIISNNGNKIKIRYNNKTTEYQTTKAEILILDGNLKKI